MASSPYGDNVAAFAVTFEGFRRGAGRFRDAAKARDPEETYIPLAEALNWAIALDDRVIEYWAPEGRVLGWSWRQRVPHGDIVRGVRWARNRVHHQWVDAVALDDGGVQLPVTLPTGFFEWAWRPAADLPLGENDRDRDAYKRTLEGTPARFTLDALEQTYAFLRGVLEPHSLDSGAAPGT